MAVVAVVVVVVIIVLGVIVSLIKSELALNSLELVIFVTVKASS